MKDEIPDNVINSRLYKRAKDAATTKFGAKSSMYRSMFIVSEYKRLGGKYSGPKEKMITGGARKWLSEEWIQVIPYIKEKKKVVCGDRTAAKKGCRPFKRIDEKTPITIKELMKIHSKEKLIELAKKKKKDMDLRINWKAGTVYKPSTRS